jgi:dTDP-4-amino-4,6-dideoxygalactose transaminase
MLTTNDAGIAESAGRRRNHGASLSEEARHAGPRPYSMPSFDVLGFNYRMTDVQATVGIEQLHKLDRFIAERAEGARFYTRELRHLSWLSVPDVPEGDMHSWQSFVVRIDPGAAPMSRDMMMETLEARGVATRPGTHAIHMLGYYRDRFGTQPDDYPVAKDCACNTMAIPLHNHMSNDDYSYVVECLCDLDA